MANILHVCGWFDPSGDVTRSVIELNKYSEHKHDVIVKWHHPAKSTLHFPEPFGQSQDNGHVNERFAWADAIIYHLVGWNCPIGYNIRTYNKPAAFRNANVMWNGDKFYCFQEFFSNPYDPVYKKVGSCHTGARDFMGEDTAFLPALMPIDGYLYTPDWDVREPAIGYIKHAPEIDHKLINYTGARSLSMNGMHHQQVMTIRRKFASVTIDNTGEGHYGLAGTESLSQGIPSIAWNHPITIKQLEDIAPGVGNPFLQADDLRTAVKKAVEYLSLPSAHDEMRCNARVWIEKYYNSKHLIERYWEPFCDNLARS